MHVDPELLTIPANVGELIKAATYTRDYGYKPGIHLHMQTFNARVKTGRVLGNGKDEWITERRLALVIGEQAYKASAMLHAAATRDHIDFEETALTPDELDQYMRENHPDVERHANDRGARARVLSLNSMGMAREMGRAYEPEWAVGVALWLGVPKIYNGEKTYPGGDKDRIPAGRTAADVARRRALKKAIMARYPLLPLDSLTADQRARRVLEQAMPDSPPPPGHDDLIVTRRYDRDDNGQILTAGKLRPVYAPIPAMVTDADFYTPGTIPGEMDGATGDPAESPAPTPTIAPEPPLARLQGVARDVFGPDAAAAEPWLCRRFTAKRTPDNVRDSFARLTADETDELIANMRKTVANLQRAWRAQKQKNAIPD